VEEEPRIRRDKAPAAIKEVARGLKGANGDEPTAVEAAWEDAFIPLDGEIAHEGPPKDPNAPSGSLSSDDCEAIAVDFAIPDPTRPNIRASSSPAPPPARPSSGDRSPPAMPERRAAPPIRPRTDRPR
jgi:hypothetical protein